MPFSTLLLPLPFPANPNRSSQSSSFPASSFFPSPRRSQILSCALRAKKAHRTGKQRYPSEKKKLKLLHEPLLRVDDQFEGFWRLSNLAVPVDKDPGKDFVGVSEALLEEIAKAMEFPVASVLPVAAFSVLRKSFDARKLLKAPKFVYTVKVDVKKLLSLEPRAWDFINRLKPKVGLIEHIPHEKISGDLISIIDDLKKSYESTVPREGRHKKPKIAIVGSGPSGLFASLVLAELGADVTVLERGQAVEQRGRDIGALVARRMLQLESNFCFGEGGAGTWSDGKLVTRTGKNSGSVLVVMRTLVSFGAPMNILIDGKPHLGTDRLIPLLKNFRQHLQHLGVTIKFGTKVDDLLIHDARVVGVKVSGSNESLQIQSQEWRYDAVVLAVGHSARDVYHMLFSHSVDLVPKDFAVGLRIEHPQELINCIQYSKVATEIRNGRGKVPVADYKLAGYIRGENDGSTISLGEINRSCYSFCMCPGGQVVLTSTNPAELCINGMSFSRRASRWANAALVVTVSPKDFDALNFHGPLAGVEFQREFERRAAKMGGGNFVVPVQTVTDYLDSKLSVTSIPRSSYRLGVKAANLHELLPVHIKEALQHSLLMFDKELPGFISKDALLHGIETRTSSPVQISRNPDSYESTSLRGLYPVGEGAGYAGGIVSAAVDGMQAGFAVAKHLNLYNGDLDSVVGKARDAGVAKY